MNTNYPLHNAPFSGTNNKKKTKGRIKSMQLAHNVQNVEIHDKSGAFMGYRHVFHPVNPTTMFQ